MSPDSEGLDPANVRMEDPSGTVDFGLVLPRTTDWAEILDMSGPGGVRVLHEGVEQDPREGAAGAGRSSKGNSEQRRETEGSPDGSDRTKPWVQMPTPPGLGTDTTDIWHYTTAAGAIGIIEGRSLWATAVTSLNDAAEFAYGREMLEVILSWVYRSRQIHPLQKEFIRHVVELADDVRQRGKLFVVCASLAEDSLSQWRAYGGLTPHAVRISPNLDLALLGARDEDYQPGDAISHWAKVLYDRDAQAKLIQEVLGFLAYVTPNEDSQDVQEVMVSHCVILLVRALLHCKDKSFSGEVEVRLVIYDPADDAIRFRGSGYGIVPYVLVAASDHPRRSIATPSSRQLIAAGAVGPFGARDVSASAMVQLLRSAGVEDPDVFVSESTLR